MIYETTIFPGAGIGNNIKLGFTLYEVIIELNKHDYKYQVIYSEKNYYESPILVQIIDLDLRLTFQNKKDQTLNLIEVLHLGGSNTEKPLRLLYKGQSLNEFESVVRSSNDSGSFEHSNSSSSLTTSNSNSSSAENGTRLVSSGPSFQLIYNKILGPTYPGVLNKNTKSYILSYPGIAFKYKINNEELYTKLVEQSNESVLDTLINWDHASDIVCDSIAIFKGKTWSEYKANSQMVQGSTFKVDLDNGVIVVNGKRSIKIGKSTQQDVIDIIGPPDDRFSKYDSRLLIHNYLSGDSVEEAKKKDFRNCKFHNYYKLGLDILYDLKTPALASENTLNSVVNKVILHNGGIVEDLSFMKWNRCNWTIESSQFDPIDSTMYFADLPPGFKDLTPVFLNRYESEFIDNDLDIIDLPSIDVKKGSVKSAKLKRWGQSKLYGLQKCIVEVLNSNGCISSVTIY
ncbi:hypothetical protein CANMA_003459 [Candida margitis]|uniref:uncharacterized protein n=1 Tax=Candida margitis TaxID=1775924 RepID=UPI0022274F96|nr:uncharacterized protein CANMA_003459 [Candida margitis]KAI5964949.1 hypothetical protein CANMA_003459 [Candida margitis]